MEDTYGGARECTLHGSLSTSSSYKINRAEKIPETSILVFSWIEDTQKQREQKYEWNMPTQDELYQVPICTADIATPS